MNNRDRMRRWRKRNPERARRQGAKDRLRLKERDPDYHRRWYQENAEKERKRSREIMRKDRRDHPERERKRKRRYRAKHRAAIQMREREKTYARRALQPYSADLARLMSELMTQPCSYCGAEANITIDHIVPLSRGGKHEAANLAPACFSCNSSKSNRLLSEWKGRL
jgi:5-methylcytosine-specific restriction endonuclease McrA